MGGIHRQTALPFLRWPSEGIYGWNLTYCEVGFGEEEDIEELVTLNPAKTITRLRRELRSAAAADRLLIRPKKKGPPPNNSRASIVKRKITTRKIRDLFLIVTTGTKGCHARRPRRNFLCGCQPTGCTK